MMAKIPGAPPSLKGPGGKGGDVGACAARHIDTANVAGESTRRNLDEHLAAAAAARLYRSGKSSALPFVAIAPEGRGPSPDLQLTGD